MLVIAQARIDHHEVQEFGVRHQQILRSDGLAGRGSQDQRNAHRAPKRRRTSVASVIVTGDFTATTGMKAGLAGSQNWRLLPPDTWNPHEPDWCRSAASAPPQKVRSRRRDQSDLPLLLSAQCAGMFTSQRPSLCIFSTNSSTSHSLPSARWMMRPCSSIRSVQACA